jgi:hypothetical protein
MTGECDVVETLHNAFWTALLLTGAIESAEAAVLDGIAALDLDHVSGDGLLLATAKSAIRRRTEFPEQSEVLSILPRELQRLFLIAPNYRVCFVLRVLIGFTPELCSGLLCLSIREVEEELFTALREMPRIEIHPRTQRWPLVRRHRE